MKHVILSLALATVTSVAFAADTEKTTTVTTNGGTVSTSTTTGTGTITEYSPGSTFVLKEGSGPMKYRYGKDVTYVTRSGKVISGDEVRTRIKVGAPATVHYTTEGSDRVISRVVIDD
jgi:hypothetical protein